MAHEHEHEHEHEHDHRHTHDPVTTTTTTGPSWPPCSNPRRSCSLNRSTERALNWLAKEVTEPGLIVDAGSGPGVIACLFAETFPGARIVAVDGSEPFAGAGPGAGPGAQGVGDRFRHPRR
ncbi:hypothetical protein GCM10023238_17940 [Streptomyces heliomycini]